MTGFESVTETPGVGASRQQLSMMLTRYRFAAELAAGQDVLEVACGSGIGLGYLAKKARRVVGGDIDPAVLRYAEQHYAARPSIELRQFGAETIPYDDASFDLVLLYEAIYYLDDVDAFVREARRVVRPGGALVIVTVNPEWSEFNPSPFSKHYLNAAEMRALLSRHGFTPQLLGAFTSGRSAVGAIVGIIRRIAVKLHLIPKTMKGKQLLKRLFMGPLLPLPQEIDDAHGDYVPPQPLDERQLAATKVLYAVGRAPVAVGS